MTDRQVIPLFPLQVVPVPGEVLPLHIFEPRYKEMIGRCLDSGEPFGVLAELEEGLADIGCTVRIRRVVKRYEDGRLDIETEGETRLRLIETYRDHDYLTGEVEFLFDDPVETDSGVREQATALHMKLLETIGNEIQPSGYSDVDLVSFRIAPTAGLDLANRIELLRLAGESARLHFLIDHLRQLIPRVENAKERHRRVSSNGHFKEET